MNRQIQRKTLGTWWLINQGQTLIIINGGHGLMGGRYPLGAIQTDDFYKEFNSKSIIWGIVVFFNFQ